MQCAQGSDSISITRRQIRQCGRAPWHPIPPCQTACYTAVWAYHASSLERVIQARSTYCTDIVVLYSRKIDAESVPCCHKLRSARYKSQKELLGSPFSNVSSSALSTKLQAPLQAASVSQERAGPVLVLPSEGFGGSKFGRSLHYFW
jgi:hypothetical protein